MERFKSKVVEIKAAQWFGNSEDEAESFCKFHDMPDFSMGNLKGNVGLIITTLEGDHVASIGD